MSKFGKENQQEKETETHVSKIEGNQRKQKMTKGYFLGEKGKTSVPEEFSNSLNAEFVKQELS